MAKPFSTYFAVYSVIPPRPSTLRIFFRQCTSRLYTPPFTPSYGHVLNLSDQLQSVIFDLWNMDWT